MVVQIWPAHVVWRSDTGRPVIELAKVRELEAPYTDITEYIYVSCLWKIRMVCRHRHIAGTGEFADTRESVTANTDAGGVNQQLK